MDDEGRMHMGELTDAWSGHIGRSPVTDLVVDALAGNPVAVDPAHALTVIFADIGVMHQHILHLSMVVDALVEGRDL
jgi:hypothetical protein